MSLYEKFLRRFATEFGIKVADSITLHPDEWSQDDGGYNLEHRLMRIWIANGHCALSVTMRPVDGGPPSDMSFVPTQADRLLIWRAVKALRLPSIRQLQQREAEDHARAAFGRRGAA